MTRKMGTWYLVLLVPFFLPASCVCQDSQIFGVSKDVSYYTVELAKRFKINQDEAKSDFLEFTKRPHPFGSDRQRELASYLLARARSLQLEVYEEQFSMATPNPEAGKNGTSFVIEKIGYNIFARTKTFPQADCSVVLASHYDTKIVPGVDYVGANDSGSSSVLLLQLMAYLSREMKDMNGLMSEGPRCNITALWLDGEESQLWEWDAGLLQHPARIIDNTYGSRHAANMLTSCSLFEKETKCWPLRMGGTALPAFILLDMVGSPDLKLTREKNSSKKLVRLMERFAQKLDLSHVIDKESHAVSDDHEPFLKAGVHAVDLIDFNHLSTWHRAGDDLSTISYESMELAGKLAISMAVSISLEPKVFLGHADK